MEQLVQVDISFTGQGQKEIKKLANFMKNRMTNIKKHCKPEKINATFCFKGFDDIGKFIFEAISSQPL